MHGGKIGLPKGPRHIPVCNAQAQSRFLSVPRLNQVLSCQITKIASRYQDLGGSDEKSTLGNLVLVICRCEFCHSDIFKMFHV